MQKGMDLGMPMTQAERAGMLQVVMTLRHKTDLSKDDNFFRDIQRQCLPVQ